MTQVNYMGWTASTVTLKDAIDRLERVLLTESLGPHWLEKTREGYLRCVQAVGPSWLGAVRFTGNFETVSCAFDVSTDDEEVIARLTAAVVANPNYHRRQR